MAFNLDEDKNNRSDLLEWLLSIDKEPHVNDVTLNMKIRKEFK